ncbi:hypothetical protein [Halolactibacillus halophilus]|uniref:Uncharacterized protein n=1 Tax=Halolactibacillus halophilus TaxID=306540 RepID=A0ABQ0VND9_9BACI|nr:hypothetical protein [Halolactibacillus halophilus]GEM02648.1 hypothetical protein HHA03_21800 [Halolactibacillus halophilus]
MIEKRKHTAWYLKDLPGSDRIRRVINQIDPRAELEELLSHFKSEFKQQALS